MTTETTEKRYRGKGIKNRTAIWTPEALPPAPESLLRRSTRMLYQAVGFVPTPEQERILACLKRFILVAGGEQGGKSLCASKYLLARLPDTPAVDAHGQPYRALYWLVGPDYAQTSREFEYLVEDFQKIGLLQKATSRVDPGTIWLKDGSRIETKSASDPRRLTRDAPDGIVACEAMQLTVETFERIMGRVGPNRGWVFLSGTFEREAGGLWQQLWKAWQSGYDDRQSFSLPSWSNTSKYPGGQSDPEIQRLQRESSDDFFMERIAGQPVPPRGMVFPEFRADIHVQDVQYVKGLPVQLWIDPGFTPESACAVEYVQEVNGRVQVFDEIFEHGLVTEDIIDKAMNDPRYARYWKDVTGGVVDMYGTQHHSMPAVAELWLSSKARLFLSSNRVAVHEGIERLRGFLKVDALTGGSKIVFSPKCKGVLSEFGVYPNPFTGLTAVYAWKMDRDGRAVGTTPEQRHCNGITAIYYGLVDRYGFSYTRNRSKIQVKSWRQIAEAKPRQ